MADQPTLRRTTRHLTRRSRRAAPTPGPRPHGLVAVAPRKAHPLQCHRSRPDPRRAIRCAASCLQRVCSVGSHSQRCRSLRRRRSPSPSRPPVAPRRFRSRSLRRTAATTGCSRAETSKAADGLDAKRRRRQGRRQRALCGHGIARASSLSLPAGASVQTPFVCVDGADTYFRFFALNKVSASSLTVSVVYTTAGLQIAFTVGTVTGDSKWEPSAAMNTGGKIASSCRRPARRRWRCASPPPAAPRKSTTSSSIPVCSTDVRARRSLLRSRAEGPPVESWIPRSGAGW